MLAGEHRIEVEVTRVKAARQDILATFLEQESSLTTW